MKYILVTHQIMGRTWLYEKIGPKGRKRLVPTYQASFVDESVGCNYHFAVTRDSALVVFGKENRRFTINGECPPHRTGAPYRGKIDILPRNGWSVRIFEQVHDDMFTLRGDGDQLRSDILIHSGPSSSFGCMSVAGGTSTFRAFRRAVKTCVHPEEEFRVFVEPRPQSHHDSYLIR